MIIIMIKNVFPLKPVKGRLFQYYGKIKKVLSDNSRIGMLIINGRIGALTQNLTNAVEL